MGWEGGIPTGIPSSFLNSTSAGAGRHQGRNNIPKLCLLLFLLFQLGKKKWSVNCRAPNPHTKDSHKLIPDFRIPDFFFTILYKKFWGNPASFGIRSKTPEFPEDGENIHSKDQSPELSGLIPRAVFSRMMKFWLDSDTCDIYSKQMHPIPYKCSQ